MAVPTNPIILLSYVNTKLRDEYQSLDEMCDDMDLNKNEIVLKLSEIGYEYNSSINQFR